MGLAKIRTVMLSVSETSPAARGSFTFGTRHDSNSHEISGLTLWHPYNIDISASSPRLTGSVTFE